MPKLIDMDMDFVIEDTKLLWLQSPVFRIHIFYSPTLFI